VQWFIGGDGFGVVTRVRANDGYAIYGTAGVTIQRTGGQQETLILQIEQILQMFGQ
jgi:hypothetical protein